MVDKVTILYAVTNKNRIIYSTIHDNINFCIWKFLNGSPLEIAGTFKILKIENNKPWRVLGTVKDIWESMNEEQSDQTSS